MSRRGIQPRTLVLILLIVVGFASVICGRCNHASATSKIVNPLRRVELPKNHCDDLIRVVCEREDEDVCYCVEKEYTKIDELTNKDYRFCRAALSSRKVYDDWIEMLKFFMPTDCK